MQIEDLNELLSKRQRDVKRMRSQLDSITRVPAQGMTLPQLAAKAALADTLQQQLDAIAARNEVLRLSQRDPKAGPGALARRRLKTLASAFGVRRLAPFPQRAHCIAPRLLVSIGQWPLEPAGLGTWVSGCSLH